jgi:hypothetical protein
MEKRNHNNRHVELPNFCHLGVNLRIALTVEAALIAGVVARVADSRAFYTEFIALSALAQPALLLTLLALCAAGRWLRSLDYAVGMGMTLLLGALVPVLAILAGPPAGRKSTLFNDGFGPVRDSTGCRSSSAISICGRGRCRPPSPKRGCRRCRRASARIFCSTA